MRNIHALIKKAQYSKKHLWLLNFTMNHAVKFNKPHSFKITEIGEQHVTTFAPYCKKNWNHVRGVHACAIATVGELAAGLVLMKTFAPKNYRVIMSSIHIDYHYQAKKDITAKATLPVEAQKNILQALTQNDKILQSITADIVDADNTSIATVQSTWQIKDWKKVHTKV